MKDQRKTKEQLIEELVILRRQVNQLEGSETERLHAAIALRDLNAFLKNILDSSSSISIMSTDLERNILYWNCGAEKLFGYKSDEVVGKQKIDILYGGDKATTERIEKARVQIIEKQVGMTCEVIEITKDGRELWINLSLTPRFNEKGNVIGILGIGQDITERKLAENKLEHYQRHLERIVENRTAELSDTNRQLQKDIARRKLVEEALQRKTDQLEKLLVTARHLTSSLNLKNVLRRIVVMAKMLLKAYGCAIYVLEPDGRTLTPVVSIEPPYEEEVLATPLDIDNSFTGKAVKAGKGMIFNDAAVDSSGKHIPGTPIDKDERVIAVPFIVDSKALGAMCLDRHGTLFTDDDLALAETFAAYAATALKNAQTHHDLQHEMNKRKKAEKALRESLHTLADIMRAIPSGLFIYQYIPPDRLVFIDGNPEAERLTGTKAKKLHGKDFEQIVPHAIEKHIKEAYLNVMMTGEILETDDLDYENGKLKRAFRVRVFRMQHDRLGVAFENITERILVEKALQKSEEKYRFLFEKNPAISLIIALDETIIDANKSFLDKLGFTSEEVIGKPAGAFVTPEQRGELTAQLQRSFKGKHSPKIDLDVPAKDGTIHSIIFLPGQIVLFDGEKPSAILITGIDVTDLIK